MTDDQATPLCNSLKQSKDLLSVYLSHNSFSNETLALLADAFAVNTQIEEISVTHNDLSLPSGTKFLKSLKNMPKLARISLNSCQLDQDMLEILADSLIGNHNITDLNLYSNDINSEGAKVIAGMIKDKTNLKVLGLSNNYIGQHGAREIASECQKALFGLTKLSLESNLIGNLGLTAIAKAMMENESLEELYLYNNELDDDAVEDFIGMLKNKLKLRALGVEYNKIRNKGEKIFEVCATLPLLERFMMS